MKIIQFFQELKQTIIDFSETLQEVRTALKEIRESLSKVSIKTSTRSIGYNDMVSWGCIISIADMWIDKCYFTQEILNKDATNTNVLLVVENEVIKRAYFKEWNQTKEVKKIGGKYYLFK